MDKNKVSNLYKLLKASEVMTHGWHLQTNSYAQHVALEEYYEALRGMTDEVVEVWQGMMNERISVPTNITLLSISEMDQHLSELATTLLNYIELCNSPKFLNIQDLLIGIKNLVNKTRYLLTLN